MVLKSEQKYRSWVEVDLDNFISNLREIKRLIGPQVDFMQTVKADAYGHGLIPVAKKLISSNVDFLGVASIDEGIELRNAGIKIPVLVLGLILKKDIGPLFAYQLTPTVCDRKMAAALNAQAAVLKQRIPVHIKVDTGMVRTV